MKSECGVNEEAMRSNGMAGDFKQPGAFKRPLGAINKVGLGMIIAALVLFTVGTVYVRETERALLEGHETGPAGECQHAKEAQCPYQELNRLAVPKFLGLFGVIVLGAGGLWLFLKKEGAHASHGKPEMGGRGGRLDHSQTDHPNPGHSKDDHSKELPSDPDLSKAQLALKTLAGDEHAVLNLTLLSEGSIYQSDLAQKTGLSKVRITRVLDKLEGKGLIERRRRGMTNVVIVK